MRLTRERAKELLPIIQAFTEGKTIQWKDGLGRWLDFSNEDAEVNFSDCPSHYRIKSEPKYRPFKTQEECWDEMHNHPDFGWVKCVYIDDIIHINYISSPNIPLCFRLSNDSMNYSAALVFKDYTFTDGKPFGIKEK